MRLPQGLHPDTLTLGINTVAELKEDFRYWLMELKHYEGVGDVALLLSIVLGSGLLSRAPIHSNTVDVCEQLYS